MTAVHSVQQTAGKSGHRSVERWGSWMAVRMARSSAALTEPLKAEKTVPNSVAHSAGRLATQKAARMEHYSVARSVHLMAALMVRLLAGTMAHSKAG